MQRTITERLYNNSRCKGNSDAHYRNSQYFNTSRKLSEQLQQHAVRGSKYVPVERQVGSNGIAGEMQVPLIRAGSHHCWINKLIIQLLVASGRSEITRHSGLFYVVPLGQMLRPAGRWLVRLYHIIIIILIIITD